MYVHDAIGSPSDFVRAAASRHSCGQGEKRTNLYIAWMMLMLQPEWH